MSARRKKSAGSSTRSPSAGVGVVLVTTELDELVLLCDRVLVMFRGAVIGELSGDDVNRERILHAAACGEIQAAAA